MTDTPNIPPIIESEESDYRDSGIPSTVAIAGHPFHPLIVTFPIAFLVGVAGTDLAYWFTGRSPFWAQASFWLLAAGLVTGLVAAITGMLDFLRIGRVRQRSAGWIHMVANVVSLGLTVINLVLRLGNPASNILPIGLIISVVVATLLGISGWYGAELVYRHKIAVIGYSSRQ